MKACPGSSNHSVWSTRARASPTRFRATNAPSSPLRGEGLPGERGRGHYSPGVHQHRAFLGDLVSPKDPNTNQRARERGNTSDVYSFPGMPRPPKQLRYCHSGCLLWSLLSASSSPCTQRGAPFARIFSSAMGAPPHLPSPLHLLSRCWCPGSLLKLVRTPPPSDIHCIPPTAG